MTLLLITGTRHATIADHGLIVQHAILKALGPSDDLLPHEIYVGDNDGTKNSDGVDFIVAQLTRRHGWGLHLFEAEWEACGVGCPGREHRRTRRGTGEPYCPFAGPRRNRELVRVFRQDGGTQVLAFPAEGDFRSGTYGCIREARRAGLDVPPQNIIPLTVEVNRRA